MSKTAPDKNEIKQFILETAKSKQPKTVAELVILTRKQIGLAKETIVNYIIELENENMITFLVEKTPTTSTQNFLISKKNAWYWEIVIFAVFTTIVVFIVPDGAFPLVYFRYVLGSVFVLFLPGYTLIRAFYPNKPITIEDGEKTKSIDFLDRIALGLGFSIAFVALFGLFLFYSHLGLGLPSITLSLLTVIVLFSSIALFRENELMKSVNSA